YFIVSAQNEVGIQLSNCIVVIVFISDINPDEIPFGEPLLFIGIIAVISLILCVRIKTKRFS
ncbi:MAG: hypothetical protein JXA99_17225, partial [Candidatus Lokiarchaeota archaeon]|nr:hypothetical protein [Candidatus Lokiarchaeota archaeon]